VVVTTSWSALPGSVVVVGPVGVVVVVVVVGGSVVLLLELQARASQQLSTATTHALPSRGGRQRVASRLIAHRTRPDAVVRRQVTAPGRPQVDFRPQRTTSRLHRDGRSPSSTAVVATARTHLLYVDLLMAVEHSHCVATRSRTVATAA
jgi:hypothetical protein